MPRTSAKIPAAKGAAAEVPPCDDEHVFVPTSVVCCIVYQRKIREWENYTYDSIAASAAVRYHHIRRATLRIVRMLSLTINGSDRNAIDTIRVSIKIAIVVSRGSVP